MIITPPIMPKFVKAAEVSPAGGCGLSCFSPRATAKLFHNKQATGRSVRRKPMRSVFSLSITSTSSATCNRMEGERARKFHVHLAAPMKSHCRTRQV